MSFLLKFAVCSEVSELTLSLFYLDCWTPVIADECDCFSTIEDHVIIFRFAAGRKEMPLLQLLCGFDVSQHPSESFHNITEPAAMQQELLFKVLVIGDLGVGKTSIIKRYVHQIFSQHYRATIGVDFALKVLQWDSNTVIRLQLWDIAGLSNFNDPLV